MNTVPVEISTEQLLQAVERLPANELDIFVSKVIALRTRREGPRLSEEETALLLQVNRARLTPDEQMRFNELVTKRQDEAISSAELQELIEMTDGIEQRDVDRLDALRKLAHLRDTTVPLLMDTLGIKAPTYA